MRLSFGILQLIFILLLLPEGLLAQEDRINIPVVFHIVYRQEQQNLPDERVISQLKALNRDFGGTNEDSIKITPEFAGLKGKSRIQFVLATKDPDGTLTSGITRTKTSHGAFGNNDIFYDALGGKDPWDVNRYLNIWVAEMPPGIPGRSTGLNGNGQEQGVIIDHDYFGEYSSSGIPFLGRTAVHEVGHWLGLNHLEGTGACTDDGIGDTPVQASSAFNCDLNRISCGSKDMVQNFMQQNTDTCLLFFTHGQIEKMESVMATSRSLIAETGQQIYELGVMVGITAVSVFPSVLHDNTFYISNPVGPSEAKVEIMDLQLQSVFSATQFLKSGNNAVNIPSLNTGMYLLKIGLKDHLYLFKIYVQAF